MEHQQHTSQGKGTVPSWTGPQAGIVLRMVLRIILTQYQAEDGRSEALRLGAIAMVEEYRVCLVTEAASCCYWLLQAVTEHSKFKPPWLQHSAATGAGWV